MKDLTPLQQSSLRLKVFDAISRKHPSVENLGRKEFFELAGGKDLRRDRQRTAKTVVTNRGEYLRRGAQNVDFQGLDTKGGRRVRLEYKVPGRVRGRFVRARRTKHVQGGRVVSVFRDRRGRFVSVKRRNPAK